MSRRGTTSLAERCPSLLSEWAEGTSPSPAEVSYGSAKELQWLCQAGHGRYWMSAKARCRGRGCPRCGNQRSGDARAQPDPGQSLADLYPALAAEWATANTVGPSEIKPNSHRRVLWRCPTGQHPEYWASPNKRVGSGRGCAACGIDRRARTRSTPTPGQSLGDIYPQLLEEWDPDNVLDPFGVNPGSAAKAQWTCATCGHAWQAQVKTRAAGTGCPKCRDRANGERSSRPAEGSSLADLQPLLIAEWDWELNDLAPSAYSARSSKPVYWVCPVAADHRWEARIAERVGSEARPGTGCPFCGTARRAKASSTNNITLRPDLLQDFDLELNEMRPEQLTTSSRALKSGVALPRVRAHVAAERKPARRHPRLQAVLPEESLANRSPRRR